MCVCVCACVRVSVGECINTCRQRPTLTCAHVETLVRVCVRACVCVRVRACSCVYTTIYINMLAPTLVNCVFVCFINKVHSVTPTCCYICKYVYTSQNYRQTDRYVLTRTPPHTHTHTRSNHVMLLYMASNKLITRE